MNQSRGQTVGYVRVSSSDQNVERQLEIIKDLNPDEIFIDHASGKNTDRPQLTAALKYLRKGDRLVIHSMDRLARNLDDLRKTVKELTDRAVTVHFIKESLTFTGDDSPMSTLLLSVMGAFAEFERSLIRERQREGIAIAKAKGVYKGRKAALSSEQIAELKIKDAERNFKNRSALAREFAISRETLYKYLAAS